MAFRNFTTLSSRNQSSLITQLYKLVNFYGELFPTRDRQYLKEISVTNKSIYWLEDEEKKIIAVSIADPNYVFNDDNLGIELQVISHTISRRPGQMDRILSHMWSDFSEKSIVLLCRKSLGMMLDLPQLNLVCFSPDEIQSNWESLSTIKTDFFNLQHENLFQGMMRKDFCAFIRFTEEDLEKIKTSCSQLYERYIQSAQLH